MNAQSPPITSPHIYYRDPDLLRSLPCAQAWLDTESDYRLKTQKAQDASEGSQYSAQRYEKWAVGLRLRQLSLPPMTTAEPPHRHRPFCRPSSFPAPCVEVSFGVWMRRPRWTVIPQSPLLGLRESTPAPPSP